MRLLAEQAGGGGADALQFAAEWRQIQIGFENLCLAPALLQPARSADLGELLQYAAAIAAGFEIGIEQTGQLHRQGAGTARAALQSLDQCAGCRLPVNAAVLGKTLVFRRDHRALQHRRDLPQRHPRQTPHRTVDAADLQRLAVAIQPHRFGWAMGGAHLAEIGESGVSQAGERKHQYGNKLLPAQAAAPSCRHDRYRLRQHLADAMAGTPLAGQSI